MSTFATKPDQCKPAEINCLCLRWRLGTDVRAGELCWHLRITGLLLEEAFAQHAAPGGITKTLWRDDHADTVGCVEVDRELDLIHISLPDGLLALTCQASSGEVLYARTNLVETLGYAGGRSERIAG
jgi:hypothetical protein